MPEDITLTQINPGEDADADVLMGNFNTLKNVLSSTNSRLDTVSDTATSALSGSISKSGGTMTGNLTISKATPYIYLKHTSQKAGTAPSANQYNSVVFTDKEDKPIGQVGNIYGTNGNRYSYITSAKGNGTGKAEIRVGFDASGNNYTYAPTVSFAKAIDNTILTKAGLATWTNSKDAITFINGLKMCMFVVTGQSTDSKTYTLPITFSGGNTYTTFLTQRNGGDSTQNIGVTSQKASKITIYAEDGEREDGINVFCIGY